MDRSGIQKEAGLGEFRAPRTSVDARSEAHDNVHPLKDPETGKTPQENTITDLVKNILQESKWELIVDEHGYDSLDDVIADHLRAGTDLMERYKGNVKKVARIITDAIISDGGFVKKVGQAESDDLESITQAQR
ncbi:MAG: hypothetical protein COU33_01935 [Candidatus Magasanikbacteria bacterium CG10_big_fil_rev_8_21_14_0_10_43_6]|uniref:Uncharacterized protein n=1 Tax=Candidatus Magasanikbacteria bacterium CG10_big_fil_rev_8_21_14_0_10_43_6 TaxID=1974650 RepID=A0A2M6W1J2_9BACT|nr:MAG: hypothetical protein COU33_01935 [Candidatus Magasanikbacteria bacterium CG10_big_fil_rev_8_21_14_0_10_43_6]